MVQGR